MHEHNKCGGNQVQLSGVLLLASSPEEEAQRLQAPLPAFHPCPQ